ncbi:DUF2642 domain-containing protein [Paenibacillus sediminis]|uniref:DUF2642 domain-containing protein n=1 Tax=Paenibacillus sediminis TaxID=664909 RepID=A0ABS4H2V1_9BACL|nr:DUF2642 domain-containing protein [Paenibacillus sediminis]MBP1936841.1 hypothetical protein [Paenibacillus sediminis]
MNFLSSIMGKNIELELSGQIERLGVLIDCGPDVVVIFDGTNYLYIPFRHIRNIRPSMKSLQQMVQMPEERANRSTENELSYQEVLRESKEMLLQIFLSGSQSIYGYVTEVFDNYFVYFSTVHRTLLIPIFHLKWLIPYPHIAMPYSLKKETLPVNTTHMKLGNTFEEQLKNMEGEIVVFDGGSHPDKVGLLKSVQNHIAEVITADQKPFYWNIEHIKMVRLSNIYK